MSAATGKELRLVVVSAGASDPSSTAMLADRLAARTVAAAASHGAEIAVTTIELARDGERDRRRAGVPEPGTEADRGGRGARRGRRRDRRDPHI